MHRRSGEKGIVPWRLFVGKTFELLSRDDYQNTVASAVAGPGLPMFRATRSLILTLAGVKVLEQAGIVVDMIAGTSAGASVGAMTGYRAPGSWRCWSYRASREPTWGRLGQLFFDVHRSFGCNADLDLPRIRQQPRRA